jgi:hypothetical protein
MGRKDTDTAVICMQEAALFVAWIRDFHAHRSPICTFLPTYINTQ